MSIFQAIVMGIVQGATEFLPISSSGHLVLVPWLLNWDFSEAYSLPFDVIQIDDQVGGLFRIIAQGKQCAGPVQGDCQSRFVRREVMTYDRRHALFQLAAPPQPETLDRCQQVYVIIAQLRHKVTHQTPSLL